MSWSYRWYDDEQTILVCDVRDSWTWDNASFPPSNKPWTKSPSTSANERSYFVSSIACTAFTVAAGPGKFSSHKVGMCSASPGRAGVR